MAALNSSTLLLPPRFPPRSVVKMSLPVVLAMAMKTCRNCKKQFDPLDNSPRSCRYHSAHYGGETKRKFESVYKGGTMDTSGGGEISHYWHCCGNPDPFDAGCQSSPHLSYDD